ncbi:hypothetical protein GGP99_003320 [Salinibacter ruber]|uniref:Uncharacterized protein n=1 Tax=Salinibacter ruber TaxID=146919 RepID=A0AAW5PBS6_9BACT|nr:hypothetical protein [Salinibacter ruber]
MDVETFVSSLLDALADRPFVQSVDVETEAFVVRGRVLRERDRFLQERRDRHNGVCSD